VGREKGRGAGTREKGGLEVTGKREKKGWEEGELGKKLHNIAQYLITLPSPPFLPLYRHPLPSG